ncbi:hypothetical protein Tco_1523626 [Tanacetum coccineum]
MMRLHRSSGSESHVFYRFRGVIFSLASRLSPSVLNYTLVRVSAKPVEPLHSWDGLRPPTTPHNLEMISVCVRIAAKFSLWSSLTILYIIDVGGRYDVRASLLWSATLYRQSSVHLHKTAYIRIFACFRDSNATHGAVQQTQSGWLTCSIDSGTVGAISGLKSLSAEHGKVTIVTVRYGWGRETQEQRLGRDGERGRCLIDSIYESGMARQGGDRNSESMRGWNTSKIGGISWDTGMYGCGERVSPSSREIEELLASCEWSVYNVGVMDVVLGHISLGRKDKRRWEIAASWVSIGGVAKGCALGRTLTEWERRDDMTVGARFFREERVRRGEFGERCGDESLGMTYVLGEGVEGRDVVNHITGYNSVDTEEWGERTETRGRVVEGSRQMVGVVYLESERVREVYERGTEDTGGWVQCWVSRVDRIVGGYGGGFRRRGAARGEANRNLLLETHTEVERESGVGHRREGGRWQRVVSGSCYILMERADRENCGDKGARDLRGSGLQEYVVGTHLVELRVVAAFRDDRIITITSRRARKGARGLIIHMCYETQYGVVRGERGDIAVLNVRLRRMSGGRGTNRRLSCLVHQYMVLSSRYGILGGSNTAYQISFILGTKDLRCSFDRISELLLYIPLLEKVHQIACSKLLLRLTNLNLEERYALNVALRMFTRRIVIQERVEDLQLGVKIYQKRSNSLIQPVLLDHSNLRRMTPYTAYLDIQGIIYEDEINRNRLIRTDELHKFSDGSLNHVRTALNGIALGIEMDYFPKRKWSKQDRKRARVMINAINKKLRDRRLMRSLEKFVGGRPYEGDLWLLERTI